MIVIPKLSKLRQEDSEFKASRGFILTLPQPNTQTQRKVLTPQSMPTLLLTQPTAAASSTRGVS